MMGALAVVSGVAGLFHFGVIDPLADVLPSWLALLSQGMYLTAGVALLVGVARGSFSIEAFGLVLLATVAGTREIVFVIYFGPHAVALTSVVFYLAILWACGARLRTLLRRQTVIAVRLASETETA
jgi:hypothetical protein